MSDKKSNFTDATEIPTKIPAFKANSTYLYDVQNYLDCFCKQILFGCLENFTMPKSNQLDKLVDYCWTLCHFYFELILIENWHTIYVSSRSSNSI